MGTIHSLIDWVPVKMFKGPQLFFLAFVWHKEAYGAQETTQKVKKSTNGNVFPFPWTQRQNRRPVQSQAETLKNMNFMTELASDIIGDLRGLLSDIKNEENILRNEQTSLARIMEEALEHSDIDPADPDRLLRLS